MSNRPGPRQSRPRSEAHYSPERGNTYLIHFERPFHHAGHYRGWTPRSALERFADHLAGRGANLTARVAAAGIGMKLARVWPDTTRDYEDAIKHHGGAARMCPECGAKPGKPRLATGKPRPEAERERLPLWELERLGTSSDGEPLPMARGYAEAGQYRAQYQVPDPDPDVRAEAAALDELARSWTDKQEDPMTVRDTIARALDRRGAAAERARQAGRDRAHDEADRLAREADRIDVAAGRRPGQPLPLPAGRAARVRDYIGPDLVRGARAQASAPAPEPVLQGAELDAELGRLAEAFPEPGAVSTSRDPYWREAEDREFARLDHVLGLSNPRPQSAAEAELAGPEPGPDAAHWSPDLAAAEPEAGVPDHLCGTPGANGGQCGLVPDHDGGHRPVHVTQPELDAPGPDAARWAPAPDAPDHLYGAPECAAAEPEGELAARQDAILMAEAGINRLSPETESLWKFLADVQPGGALNPDPGIGYGGYEVDDMYQREQQAREEQTRQERAERSQVPEWARSTGAGLDDVAADAGYEADAPDHLYGAPECAEGNPEAAHFGWDSPEAQDRGSQRLPVVESTLTSPWTWRDLAPEAATLPDGTPHASPYLAERGWQAQGGIYARAPQLQAEAG